MSPLVLPASLCRPSSSAPGNWANGSLEPHNSNHPFLSNWCSWQVEEFPCPCEWRGVCQWLEEGGWKDLGPACLQKHCKKLSFQSNTWSEPSILGLNLSVHMAASLLALGCVLGLSLLFLGGPSRPSPESSVFPLEPNFITTQSLQHLWTQDLWDLSLYELLNANKQWSISKPAISPETALQRGPNYRAQCLQLEWEAQPKTRGQIFLCQQRKGRQLVFGTWPGVFWLGLEEEDRAGTISFGCFLQMTWRPWGFLVSSERTSQGISPIMTVAPVTVCGMLSSSHHYFPII